MKNDDTSKKIDSVPMCACDICFSGYITGGCGEEATAMYHLISNHISQRFRLIDSMGDVVYRLAQKVVKDLEDESP